MSKCGRNLLGSFKTLAVLTLTAVTGLLGSVRAGAQTTQTPSSYNFGNVAILETSLPEKITVRNTGAASITINSYSVTGGPYAISTGSSTCLDPGTLGAGATCIIAVTVTPTSIGTVPAGTLTLNTTASNSPQSVIFSATGVEPVTLSSPSMAFGSVVVGATSGFMSVTLANNQPTSVTIGAISVTPGNGFAIGGPTTCSINGQLTARSLCNIALTFTPGALGPAPATTLSVTTTQSGTPLTIPLTGSGIAPTQISPPSITFGSVAVGQTSLIKVITLTNEQSSSLSISSIVAPAGGFAIDPSTTCPNPGSLAAHTACNVGVTFTPTVVGPAPTGSAVTITTNASNSPQSVPVTGSGAIPVSFSSSVIHFGNVALNQTSAIQTVTVTNNQTTQTVTFSTIGLTGDSQFALDPSSTCSAGTPLAPSGAPGSACTLAFTFTPTSAGLQPSGTTNVGFNASNAPMTVTLSGVGVQATTISPTAIGFGVAVVNTQSPTRIIKVNNLQAATLSLTSLIFSGPFQLDTSSNTTCPMAGGTVSGTLAANSTCLIGIIFAPTVAGSTSGGQVTVISSSPSGPMAVSLAGAGVNAVSFGPTGLNFGNVPINITSTPSNINVTNNQSANLDFTSIAVPAPYSISAGTTTCVVGTPLLPGEKCVISVTVDPTAVGAVAASVLTLNDDVPSSPQTAPLSATGVPQVQINPSTIGFGTLVVNQENTGTTTLTNFLSTPIVIDSIASFTAPYTLDTTVVTTCPLAPEALGAGQKCKIGIDVTPTAIGSMPGSATLVYNVSGSSTMVDLPIAMTGVAYLPVAILPSPVSFPTAFVGVPSAVVPIKVKNLQGVPLTISAITVGGTDPSDFSISSNLCPVAPATLPANSNCIVNMTFTPAASGARNATLSVADDALGSPQTVSLTGDGNAPLKVAPLSVTSYQANVGAISAYQTVTITNQTTNTITLNAFQLNGDFQQTATTCGATLPYALAGGASCNVTISFAPTIGGTRGGQLQVMDTAATSPQVINLQGHAYNPLTLSQSGMAYSAQLVGTTSSPAKVMTLINHENESESFTLTPSGPFSATTNCTTGTIAANSSCTLYVDYSPTTVTPPIQSGSITVNDSAPGGSPLVLSLTGTASATNPAPAVAVVSPGASAGGTSLNVTITGNGWTHFSSSSVISFVDTDSASYAPDITVNSVNAVTPNTIIANLTIANAPVYGARNIKVVTPLSAGGTETARLDSAFIISDPTQTFEITSITPGVATQGQGYEGVAPLTVNIVATGTSFVGGTTFANFGDGVTVESLDITGATTATAVLAISNTTTVGYRSLTMVTGGQVANSVLNDGNPLFYIGPNSAKLTGVTMATVNAGVVTCTATPVSVAQSFAGPVCITATGTHFLQNATGITVTGGVTVGDTIVTSQTTAYSNVIVPAGATIGVDNVTVATGGEISTLANSFTVTGSTPALISVTPNSGQQGQSLTVNLTGNSFTTFNACPGGVLTADFTGVISSPTVTIVGAHKVSIPIVINENAPTGGITANLTCGGAGSATIFSFGFTIEPSSASIVSVTPSSVPQGGQVTLNVTGLNTDWSQTDTMSAFYPTPIATPLVNETTILSPTSAQLAISVPTNTPVGTYCFYMATGGQIVSACIQVYANTPTLTMNPPNGLLPASGTNPITVNFTGQFTHFSQSGTVPVISGEGVTLTGFTVNNPDGAMGTINIAAGAAPGTRLITFTTGGEIVTTYFNVTTIPVYIVNISPYHGPQSTTMNVTIQGLNTHFVSGNTQVIFGGPQITVNSVTVENATHLTANITTSYTPPGLSLTPTPPGWNTVYVNDPSEQLLTGFLVDAPATPSLVNACVTADLPTSCVSSAPQGSGGTDVTITGSLTNWVQGQSELVMGAGITVADLVITSPTTATATISVSPTAPVGGNSVIMITPLTGGGFEYDSGSGFSVTPSAAYISDVSLPACKGNTDANFVADFCNNGTSNIVPVVSQLQTSSLNVTGVGTHWLQGETTMSFGPGVAIDQLTINSPTTATVQITVLSSSPVGFATATASTDGENASLVQAIDIEEGSPTFLAFSPQGAQQGATLNVEVLGRFTNWSAATPPIAEFNQDISINSLTVVDSETLVLNVTVSPWAYVDTGSPCGHVLTITSGSEQVSSSMINDNFCVSTGAQEITGVTPNATPQGSSLQVTITGSQTNFLAGQTQVSFGDPGIVAGVPTSVTNTSMVVPVVVSTSATTGYHTVTVTTYGQVENQVDAFSVAPSVAQLTEAIPDQAEQGVQNLAVRLIGQYSHFSASSTATFGAGITVVGTPTFVSATEVDAVIDISPISYVGSRTVTVATPNVTCPPAGTVLDANVTYQGCPNTTTDKGTEIVNNNVFSIIPGPAIITGVSPNTGNEGQEIVFNITGLDTHWQQNFTQFYIAGGGSDITVNDVIINSATSATVDISISQTANAGPRSVYMVTAGESLTDSGAFVVTGGVPAISYLTPNSAQPGTAELQVTVVGNAYTQWAQGSSTVSFGPGITIDTQEVTDASHIVADITVGPTCTSPGVPVGCAQYGYRTVVVQTGTQGLTGNFDVVAPPPPPTPYVWYESPSSGIPGQTLSIYFYGANTQWDPNPTTGTTLTGWDFTNNNITLNSYQIVSPTEALVNITINPKAPAETMGLTFTTNGTTYNDGCSGCEVDNASFTIVIAQPTLSIVDPGSGLQGAQNITVNILGQFTAFDSTTTFSFGGPGSGITTVGPPTILGPTIATQTISIGQETPTGGYSVVATTTDATAANQVVVGGAGFSVTPSLATILSVSPNTSAQGTLITVNVTGFATHWSPATTFSFGAGIVVTNVTVNSETSATLSLAIPALASEGTTSATATTGGEVATLYQAFVITAGTPYLLSSGPGSVEQQGAAVFTILAQATTWSSATPPVVSYGGDITLGPVQVTSPTTLTVEGAVSPTAYPGPRNLTVTTGTQVLSINGAVYISPGPAVINSVNPSTGGQGVTFNNVQINGINTHWVQGTTTLTFPGVLVNSFTVNSPTSITASIVVNTTTNPGQVNVTATTLGEVATEVNAFTITQTQAELAFINPSSLPQGQTQNLAITGIDTNFVQGTTVVTSTNPVITINSVTVNSPTSITAGVTVSPTSPLGYKNITVTTGAQIVASNSLFQVASGPAAISGLNPADGGEGQSVQVVVSGSQTHFAQGLTTASFSGGISVTGVTVQSLTEATVNIYIPVYVPLGTYSATLTTGGEVATILNGFTVNTGSPVIANVNPPTGTQGLRTNVTLTGGFTSWVQGTSVASFGSGITVNSLTVNSATSAVANITIATTATLGSRTVTVTTNSQVASITGGFTVLTGAPTLVTSTPGSGQAGASLNLVITGDFTNFQQAFSTVSVGDGITTNFITVNSPTQITANITIPSNAATGSTYVSVTTLGTTLTLNNAFTVLPGTPVITQINPNVGTQGQTDLNVTIIGLYTNWTNGTTVASFDGPSSGITVNSTTVNSPTNLTANISISGTAPLGPVTVTTTTHSEIENVAGGFTIQSATPPSPQVISLSPGADAGGMPLNSVINAVFSEPMLRSTISNTTVLFYLTSNPNSGNVAVPGTVTLDPTGRIVTFAPNALLAPNSTYYFNMTGSIQSATGIPFSNYGINLYTTSATATTGPTVVAANPPVSSTVGTNVLPELEFSADMQQGTETGMTVSTGGNPVAGTYSWNANPYCCGSGWAQPGTVLTFTPTGGFAPATTYTVAWNNTLTDTAGNAAVPGSFTFTTGSGPDTAYNYSGSNFNNLTNVGTNFAPSVTFSKPINPIDIWGGWNSGTLLLYNGDSSKYIEGAVTVAPNGLSATFTPTVPLLPDTYYRLYIAGGNYDADGNYLYGNNFYFTTGAGTDTTPPTVTFVSPANNATSTPLNSQIVVKFSTPINDNNINVVTVTPSGGSAIAGTTSLAGDLVTLTFVPSNPLKAGKVFTVDVSGFTDLVGNSGTPFSSSFTTTASPVLLNLSTGLNASGQVIAPVASCGGASPEPACPADANWTVVPTGLVGGPTSDEALGLYVASATTTPPAIGPSQPLYVVGPGDAGWWTGGWPADGPQSDWINMYPGSEYDDTYGVYSTNFVMPATVPSNLCLVGAMSIDDNGTLGIVNSANPNGIAITGNINTNTSFTQLNIPISSFLVPGTNTLALGWGSTDNNYEAFRLQAVIETCGASVTGGLSIASSTPTNNATNVATSTSIVMNFNNAVDPATVNSSTLPIFDTWNSNYTIAGNYVLSNSNKTVTFTPASPFPVNSNIWVGACSGPLDLAGDTLAANGCYTQELNFWTGPTVTSAGSGLQVAAASPLANATNVGLRTPVYATFNRSINPYSINNSDFGLYDGEGVSQGYSQNAPWCDTNSWTHSQDDTTFYWTCYPLPSSAQMTMILNSGISDVQGDTLAPFTSSFSTSTYDSNTNGSIIGTRPGNAASGVNPNLPLILFSNLPINPSTANSGIQVAQNNVILPGTATVLDGGYTLEFVPSAGFAEGALIQWWTTGSLFETTYNTPINGDSGYYYTAGSTATLVPAVQAELPAPYATIKPNQIFDFLFNTPLDPSTITTSTIYVYDNTSGTLITGTYSQPQPNEVLIVPSADLVVGHTISFYLNNGPLHSTTNLASSTSVVASTNNWYWSNIVGPDDTTLPIVTSAVPYNGATNVAVNATPGVIFSKPIDTISVTSSTFQVLKGGTPLAGSFWFNSNDTRVDFVPNAPLPPGANLTISINGVTDIEGHPATFSSGFGTGTVTDFTAPSVLLSSVNSNDSIPTNSTIAVTFNEPMDATTFANGQPGSCGNFYIYDELSGDGLNCVATTLTWNSSQTIAYLTPTAPLAAGRQYQFVVESGTDLAGNVMNSDYFYFYADFTGSSSAPTVVAFNPIGGVSSLGTNAVIEAQFTAPIDPNYLSGVTLTYSGGTVPANVYAEAGDTVVQIIPTTPLLPTTTYTMNIVGVQDPAGNVVATVTNSFMTGATYDVNSPTVVESVPIYNATVGTNVIPKFVFNKPLNPLTVNASSFRIYLYDTGQWIPSTVTLSSNGLEVTITPQIPLLPNTEYEFSGGWGVGPYDEDGNYYSLPWYYFWTTGGTDLTAPTVTISPSTGTSGVPVNTLVQVAVSVPVDPTTITQSSITLKNGSTQVSGTVTLANSQLLVFTPSTSALKPAQTFLGCYNDNQNNIRVLTDYQASNNEMTVEQCVSSCHSSGYQYAGVQDATQCFCGNGNYSSQGVSTSCNMACAGNGSETCGGNGANSVYTTQSEVVPQNLAAGTSYTIHVSGFTDTNGNAVAPANSTFTTAATASSSDLVITSASVNITGSPSTNVSNTLPITLVFSNPLDPATVNSGSLRFSLGGCCGQDIAGTYTLSNNNMTVSFTPSSGFPVQYYNPPTDTSEIPIYVSTCDGPYDVLGQEAYGGSCGNNLFSFYVSTGGTYTTPLQVTGVTPPDLATNVGRDQSVSVTFNNSLQSGSANNFNSQLYAGQDLQDDGSYSLSADNKTLTFNVGALYNNANYTIIIPAGGVEDMWGNMLSQDFVSSFSTIADPATGNGYVLSTAPSTSTSTSVPVNSLLTLYLTRPVNGSTLAGQLTVTVNGQVYTGTVQADASGYQVQYTPQVPFPNSAAVQWFFSGNVQDTYGDYFSGASGYFYTVAAVNAATAQPVVVAVSPGYGSTNVPVNAGFDIEYSQPVTAASFIANMELYDWGTGTSQTVNVTPSTGNSTVFRITLATPPLSPSTQYGICTNSNVMGANGVAAQSDCWATVVNTVASTTADTTSGTVTIGPPDNSVNVGTNAYIRVQFSKPADRTTVSSSTIAIASGGKPIPGSWSYNYSGDDLYGANFYPLNPLPPSSTIRVAVSGVLDYAGNVFSEPTITFQTAAQPDYSTPSATLDFGTTTYGIGTNASFTCLYSEPMDPSSITPGGTYIYSFTSSSTVPVNYTFSADMLSVTMTPKSPLLQNSEYYYECYNAIDLTGNAQNGNYSYFYTGNGAVTTGPTVVGVNPPNGMTNVPVNTQNGPWLGSSMGILFSEPVNGDTLGQITLTPQGGSPIPIGVTPEDGNYMGWVSLPYPLAPNTLYTFNITGVTDLNGNLMTPVTSTFTTGSGFDWNNAGVTATNPANGVTTTGVPTSVTVTFSDAMAPILINTNEIYIREHNNTSVIVPATISVSTSATPATPTTVTITPTVALTDATIYDIYYYPNPWWLTNISGINATNNYGVLATFTTGTGAAVNGVCGSANTATFSSVSSINPANLCSVGTISGQTNNGTYSWTCNGNYGGTNASCSATITPANACLTPPAGLVSWWPGNDNATDIISGNNGTLENGATYGLGEVNDAFNLTGNTAQNSDQYIDINGGTMPANLEIQNNITLSAWIYPTAYPVNYGSGAIGIIAGSQYDGSYSGATLYYDARVNPDGGGQENVPIGHIAFNLGNGSTWYVQDTQTQVPLNQWTLVTGVGTSGGQSQIYFNGVLQPSSSGQYAEIWPGTISYTNAWFQIGQETDENRPFTGLIDEVQVYNTSLTAAKILAIYNAGNAGLCP